MATARPVRAMDPYAEQFWAFTLDRELRLQQCSACAKFRWPPGPTCDRCLSDDFTWSALSGEAKVLSWTTFRRGYFPEYPPPHTVLALDPGLRPAPRARLIQDLGHGHKGRWSA